ncbi:MAG: hypothetical protein IJX92_00690 [Clostridia bacterium]|nr:hypothetical protein [Clostridia bacterium]
MKKQTKILVFILSLALIIGSAFGIAAVAADNETVTRHATAIDTDDQTVNTVTVDFTINYSKVAVGIMHQIDLLDADGNALTTFYLEGQDYDNTQAVAGNRYRIRACGADKARFDNGSMNNRPGYTMNLVFDVDLAAGTFVYTCKTDTKTSTLESKSLANFETTTTPVTDVRITPLLEDIEYTLTVNNVVSTNAAFNNIDKSPKIVSKSVSYEDNVYLYYAVNNTYLEEGQELEVLLYNEDPTKNASATVYKAALDTREYTPNPAYPVYKTFGIPAKAVGDTIYAVPHIVGTDVTYDNMVTYSVAEYCWEMLYTTSPSESKAKLYNALLNYGIAAQEVFSYNTDKYLLSSLAYVCIDGGTLNGESTSLVVDTASEANTVTPYAEGIDLWKVTTYADDGTASTSFVNNGAEHTVTGHTVISSASYTIQLEDKSGDADPTKAVATLNIKYDEIALGQHMNYINFLDADGNVLYSVSIYCYKYDDTRRFIRLFDTTFRSANNINNIPGQPIEFKIEYEWSTGAINLYTNGTNNVLTSSATPTDVPVAAIQFTVNPACASTIVYTENFTTAELQ